MVDYYDYSEIPPIEINWDVSDNGDEYFKIEVSNSGISYIGYDWTSQSGGAYMGGFQSFDEFLDKGPINNMPKSVEEEIKNHLKKYRKKGGVKLVLSHDNELKEQFLWRAFIHLDGTPIKIEQLQDSSTYIIFQGAIPSGDHELGVTLLFKDRGKSKENDPFWKVQGKFSFTIETSRKEAFIKLLTYKNESEDQILTKIIQE